MPPKPTINRPLYLVVEAVKNNVPDNLEDRDQFILGLNIFQLELYYLDSTDVEHWDKFFDLLNQFVPDGHTFQDWCIELMIGKLNYLDFINKGKADARPLTPEEEKKIIEYPVQVIHRYHIDHLPLGILEKCIKHNNYTC